MVPGLGAFGVDGAEPIGKSTINIGVSKSNGDAVPALAIAGPGADDFVGDEGSWLVCRSVAVAGACGVEGVEMVKSIRVWDAWTPRRLRFLPFLLRGEAAGGLTAPAERRYGGIL